MISIYLAVEDDLSEFVLRRVLNNRPAQYYVNSVFKQSGFGYLRKNCAAFNNMAKVSPVLLLTDLDRNLCPSSLINDWIQNPLHPNFLFRIAIREVEAWLLANDTTLKDFLGVRRLVSYPNPESLQDPKANLLLLAESSTKRIIRESLVRRDTGGNLCQGPAYNSTLANFVQNGFSIEDTASKCPSFSRLLLALDRLEKKLQ